METKNKKTYFSCILFLFFAISSKNAFCLELDNDGGYTLRIAVDSNIGRQSIREASTIFYIKNIKDGLTAFNTQLHSSTRGQFYIKNVELLIPSGWETTETKEYISDSRNYERADIKISRSENFPYVERTQVCGAAGQYLELPRNFFSEPENGAYGKPGKALAALWAQLRYGVFEENGFENDAHFPYFYRRTESSDYEATGCANEVVKGSYKTPAGEVCDPKSSMKPLCRFYPATDNSNSAIKSSLMHFHWLDSVTEFCDETTHNPLSPNRQNALCGSRSVWSIIQSTDDYKKVTNPSTTTPAMNFKVVEQAPLFYFLMDRGKLHPGAYDVIIQGLPLIMSLFAVSDENNWALPADTLAAIGAYPNPDDPWNEVEDLVPWSTIKDNEDKFFEAIHFTADGPEVRDVSRAIKEVIEKIKDKNHAAGGVILLLKTAETSPILLSYPEEALLADMKKNRIFLNTIEINTTGDGEPHHVSLINLARESGGIYATLEMDKMDLQLIIDNTLGHVIPTVETYSRETDSNPEIIYNGPFDPTKVPLAINTRSAMRNLRVSYTTFASHLNESISLGPYTNFQKRTEWNATEGAFLKRNVYTILLTGLKNEALNFLFTCRPDEVLGCAGHLSVYATYSEENLVKDTLNVKVSTSAVNNKIDFLTAKEPLSIFAKVSADGVPATGLAATTTVSTSIDAFVTLPLSDDGKYPDVAANDGIYSASYKATKNGAVSISVEVRNNNEETTVLQKDTAEKSSDHGRILPVDQSFPSGKPFAGPTKKYSVAMNYPISIVNFESFKPYPEAINSLKLTIKEELTVSVKFQWPNIIGNPEGKVDSYILKTSASAKELIENFNAAETVTEGKYADTAGNILAADFSVEDGKFKYYAIKTTYGNTQSDLSNIVGVLLATASKSNQVTGFGILTICLTFLSAALSF